MKKIKEVRNDTLNASIMTQDYVVVDGVEYYGDLIEVSEYHNSAEDRERLAREQPEQIVTGILAVWGDTPLVVEPELEKEGRITMAIVNFILANWLEWLYALVIFFLSLLYGNVTRHLKNERAKNEAIAEGVQSLLRENIVGNYNKYQDRKHCPIYAKESLRKAYKAYHNLGGNDVATKLYTTLLAMPEEVEEQEEK